MCRFDELRKDVMIVNELGIHARAAAKISKVAQLAKSNVWIVKNGAEVDAKSIIDILTLAAAKGSYISILIQHADDAHVLHKLTALVESGFEE